MAGRKVIDNASKLVTVESGNFCKMFLEIYLAFKPIIKMF